MPYFFSFFSAFFFFSSSIMALDLKSYSELQVLLASDKLEQAQKQAQSFLQQEKPDSVFFSALKTMGSSSDELALRKAFGELSQETVERLKKEKSQQSQWQLFFCPMTPKGVYGYWVQPLNTDLRNPYFGAKMLTCGVKRKW